MGCLKTTGIIILLLALIIGIGNWYMKLPGKNGLGRSTTA